MAAKYFETIWEYNRCLRAFCQFSIISSHWTFNLFYKPMKGQMLEEAEYTKGDVLQSATCTAFNIVWDYKL